MIKVVRWPELDIIESDLTVVEQFYTHTSKGILLRAHIFPLSQLELLTDLKKRITAKKKELSDIEAEIYKVSRDFNP